MRLSRAHIIDLLRQTLNRHRRGEQLRAALKREHARLLARLPKKIPIAAKLTAVFTLLLTFGMVSLGLSIGNNQSSLMDRQIQEFGSTLVNQMAESVREPLLASDKVSIEIVVNNLAKEEKVLGAAIFSDEQKPVAAAGIIPAESVMERLNQDQLASATWKVDGEQPSVAFSTPVRYRDIVVGYALLSFERSLLEQAKRNTFWAVTTITLLLLVLGTIASWFLAGRLTRPINELMDATRAISAGNYQYRITNRRNDELGVLMEAMNSMGEGLLRKEQVEQVFSRYVSPQVASRVLHDLDEMEKVSLGGHHTEASVLFADIVGFTAMSEKMAPDEVSNLLNDYFGQIAQAVNFCGGHIDKFMGDCAMIVFGVPEQLPDHAFRAVACAAMIMDLVEQKNRRREKDGLEPVEFRIGVNSGQMLAGNMGSADRMEYTVVGDSVNLASRLGHAGNPGEVILSAEMCALEILSGRIETEQQGTIRLRGKSEPVAIFRVTAITDPFNHDMQEENRRLLEQHDTEAA